MVRIDHIAAKDGDTAPCPWKGDIRRRRFSRRGRSQELILELTEQVIREGQACGEVRADTAVGIARALLLAAHGFVLSAHTMVDDAVTMEELDAELELLICRMLERP